MLIVTKLNLYSIWSDIQIGGTIESNL